MDTQVKLEHEVSFRWLIVFALPTILSSIFSSLYSTVDGIFIARLVDTDALSAINITMPMIFLASAIGMMFGSGGNALVAKKLGEGKQREAQEDFSLLMAVAFIFRIKSGNPRQFNLKRKYVRYFVAESLILCYDICMKNNHTYCCACM